MFSARLAEFAEQQDISKTNALVGALEFVLEALENGAATSPLDVAAAAEPSHQAVVLVGKLGIAINVVVPGELPSAPAALTIPR